jgi:hypothetical protein
MEMFNEDDIASKQRLAAKLIEKAIGAGQAVTVDWAVAELLKVAPDMSETTARVIVNCVFDLKREAEDLRAHADEMEYYAREQEERETYN